MKISSVGKKVAIGAGAAAAVGLTALAYAKGKKNLAEVDTFVNSNAVKKAGMAIGNGFQTMGKAVVAGIKKVPEYVKAGFERVKGLFNKAKVEEAVTEASAQV